MSVLVRRTITFASSLLLLAAMGAILGLIRGELPPPPNVPLAQGETYDPAPAPAAQPPNGTTPEPREGDSANASQGKLNPEEPINKIGRGPAGRQKGKKSRIPNA